MTNINLSLNELADLINTRDSCKVLSTLVGEVLKIGENLVGEEWRFPWTNLDLENATHLSVEVELPDGWGDSDSEDWEIVKHPQGWVLEGESRVYNSLEKVFSSRYLEYVRLISSACNLFTDGANQERKVVWKEF